MSPTIWREGPYRFHFYSHEPNEPPHVHVDRDDLTGKFWLDPVSVAYNWGYSGKELRKVQAVVEERCEEFLEAWNDYFGT